MRALPGAAEIAARNDPLPKSSPEDAVKPETMTSAAEEKQETINAAKATLGAESSKYDHLSAPASAIHSGTQTPAEPAQSKSSDGDATKTETTTSAPEEKTETINAAKAALGTESSKYDHLSAPASAIHSGTQTPAEATKDSQVPFSPAIAEPAEGNSERTSETHRGSDVLPLPSEEIKKVESENAITEDAEEETGNVTKGVEGLQVGDGKDVQEQKAEEPADAGKSVED